MVLCLAFYNLDGKKIRNRERNENCKNLQTIKTIQYACLWGFSYFTLGITMYSNPGRQMYDKSLVQFWCLSENTCSVKGKNSFCYKNKQTKNPPPPSLFSCLLWGFRTQSLECQRQLLPFQEEARLREADADQSLWALHIHISQLFSIRKFQ